MRIGIREQLGLLVLLTTLIALAVVAVATVFRSFPYYSSAMCTDQICPSGSTITIS